MDAERRRLKEEDEVQRGRRLTYDHGEAFSGSSSPFRSGNYEALVGYLTEIGECARSRPCLPISRVLLFLVFPFLLLPRANLEKMLQVIPTQHPRQASCKNPKLNKDSNERFYRSPKLKSACVHRWNYIHTGQNALANKPSTRSFLFSYFLGRYAHACYTYRGPRRPREDASRRGRDGVELDGAIPLLGQD